jgi:hypothetical protein
MLTELIELGRCRLDRGWTYRQLAIEINKVSPTHIGHSRLFRLLTEADERPNDLTLHGMRLFLDSLKDAKPKRRRSSKGRAA